MLINIISVLCVVNIVMILNLTVAEPQELIPNDVLRQYGCLVKLTRPRRRDGGKKSVQDIITLMKSTDPDDVPDFVAKELHKLHPVTFDNYKSCLVSLYVGHPTTSQIDSNNVNKDRGAQNTSISSFESVINASPAANTACVAMCPADVAVAIPAETVTRLGTSAPKRAIDAAHKPALPKTTQQAAIAKGAKQDGCVPAKHQDPVLSPKNSCDKDGFIKAEKKKGRKPPCQNQCGTALVETNMLLRPAIPMTQLYLYRLHHTTKAEETLEYIRVKTSWTLRVEKLESGHNTNFNSFVVRVPAKHLDTFLKEPSATDFKRHIIARPLVQHARTKRHISATKHASGEHHSEITMLVPVHDEELILDLRLNQDLITDNHLLSYQENGKMVQQKLSIEEIDLCHYGGTVRGKPGSWVALSTCHGVQGIVFDGKRMRYIEPAQDGNITSQHYIYDHSDLSVSNKCGFDTGVSNNTHYEHTLHYHSLEALKETTLSRYKRQVNDRDASIHIPFNANSRSRYVELVLVADNSLARGRNMHALYQRMSTLANIINYVYSPLNIFVALVNVEIWNERDEIPISKDAKITLDKFLDYRRTKLLDRMPNDNAHLITDREFISDYEDYVTIIGKAYTSTMCSSKSSGGVSNQHTDVVGLQAMTIAHELGHNFGMEHDDDELCECPGQKCIMSYQSNAITPTHWSTCSMNSLARSFWKGLDFCLRNKPKRLFKSPTCHNGFVEPGEQCDCGTSVPGVVNPCHACCNPQTCMLRANATCAAGECCDLQTCRPKPAATLCRSADRECDLPEYCTGHSEFCPDDVYKMDTTPCGKVEQAYCMRGRCRSHTDQCRLLWGITGNSSHSRCYYENNAKGDQYGHCGYDRSRNLYQKCEKRDAMCGTLQCSRLDKFLDIGTTLMTEEKTFTYVDGDRVISCYVATVDLGPSVPDPGMVPDGAKCGDQMMCLNQRCVSIEAVRQRIKEGKSSVCPSDCAGRGVCNSAGECHCEAGFAPPLCALPGPGGSYSSGPATQRSSNKLNKPNVPNRTNESNRLNKPNFPIRPNEPNDSYNPNNPNKFNMPNRPNLPNKSNEPNTPHKPNKSNSPNRPYESYNPYNSNKPNMPNRRNEPNKPNVHFNPNLSNNLYKPPNPKHPNEPNRLNNPNNHYRPHYSNRPNVSTNPYNSTNKPNRSKMLNRLNMPSNLNVSLNPNLSYNPYSPNKSNNPNESYNQNKPNMPNKPNEPNLPNYVRYNTYNLNKPSEPFKPDVPYSPPNLNNPNVSYGSKDPNVAYNPNKPSRPNRPNLSNNQNMRNSPIKPFKSKANEAKGECHCEAGFAPPLCALPGPGGSYCSGPATQRSSNKLNKPNVPNRTNESNRLNKPNFPIRPNEPNDSYNPNNPNKFNMPNRPNLPNKSNEPNTPHKPNKSNSPNRPYESYNPYNSNKPNMPNRRNEPNKPNVHFNPNLSNNLYKPPNPKHPNEPNRLNNPNNHYRPHYSNRPNVSTNPYNSTNKPNRSKMLNRLNMPSNLNVSLNPNLSYNPYNPNNPNEPYNQNKSNMPNKPNEPNLPNYVRYNTYNLNKPSEPFKPDVPYSPPNLNNPNVSYGPKNPNVAYNPNKPSRPNRPNLSKYQNMRNSPIKPFKSKANEAKGASKFMVALYVIVIIPLILLILFIVYYFRRDVILNHANFLQNILKSNCSIGLNKDKQTSITTDTKIAKTENDSLDSHISNSIDTNTNFKHVSDSIIYSNNESLRGQNVAVNSSHNTLQKTPNLEIYANLNSDYIKKCDNMQYLSHANDDYEPHRHLYSNSNVVNSPKDNSLQKTIAYSCDKKVNDNANASSDNVIYDTPRKYNLKNSPGNVASSDNDYNERTTSVDSPIDHLSSTAAYVINSVRNNLNETSDSVVKSCNRNVHNISVRPSIISTSKALRKISVNSPSNNVLKTPTNVPALTNNKDGSENIVNLFNVKLRKTPVNLVKSSK